VADGPLLNHAEMVYGPGDREAARAFFQVLGFEVAEYPAFPWLVITIDPDGIRGVDNVMYVNESTPAQQTFEKALLAAAERDEELGRALTRYTEVRDAHPQFVFHFGVSVPTHEQWEERVAALREANESHELLKGRLDLHVYEPGVPGAVGPLSQAFIYTDIIAVGPLPFSRLLLDFQWAPDLDHAARRQSQDLVSALPDRLSLV
jgi:hypothetical protein